MLFVCLFVYLFLVNLESHKHDEYHVDETELKNVTCYCTRNQIFTKSGNVESPLQARWVP